MVGPGRCSGPPHSLHLHRDIMRSPLTITLLLLAALALAAPVSAQQREPQKDYMVHMDLSKEVPQYIPDELTLVPGGTVQLMLFSKGPAHSLTLDVPGFDADVPAGTADGFYERTTQFQAPLKPGTYTFHDKYSGAKGTLIIPGASTSASAAPIIGVRENGYDLHFNPERLEVAAGSTITFRTNGSFAHTLTSATDAWNDSKLQLAPGQEATFTAPTTPGEYPFFCRYHKEGGMKGVLVVQSAPAPSATTPPTASPSPEAPTKSTPAAGLALAGAAITIALFLRMKKR